MKVVHLSDIHIADQGKVIWDTDTKRHFDNVIEKLRALDDIDAIIVSGDLSNDGSEWSYKYIDESLANLGIPTYCCPGNHDNLEIFYNGYKPVFYKTCSTFKLDKWTFVMLNSAIPDMSRGYFNPDLLSAVLASINEPVAIVLHHPPIEQEGWLNRKLLENRKEFIEVIQQSDNVRLVLYGHTHYHTESAIDDVIYSSAPSSGFAFNPNLEKFKIANGEEGFNIIEFKNDNILITNISL